MTGMYIEGYEIERELDQGGMATVYLALQKSLKRKVVLKVMAPALALDQSFSKRFLREGEMVAQFNDPRIVTVFDIGIYQGHHYLAMEYLPGGTLKKRIEQGLSLQKSIEIIKTVAGALSYAHKRSIVHRDIKPLNVLFRENEDPVLTDFGVAKAVAVEGGPDLTKTGFSVGSPNYMSPEQISNKVDPRSDLYSLGVMFYEMLTGDLPYKGQESTEVLVMHLRDPIPSLPSHLQAFQPVVNKLLAKKPAERFATADDFIAALEHVEPDDQLLADSNQKAKTVVIPKQRLDDEAVSPNVTRKPSFAKRLVLIVVFLLAPLMAASFYLFAPIELPNLLASSSKTSETRVRELLAEARQLRQQGDLDASLVLIQEGLRLMPGHAGLLALNEEVQEAKRDKPVPVSEESDAEVGDLHGDAEVSDVDILVTHYLHKAEDFYKEGAMEASLAEIDKGLQISPEHAELLDLRQLVQAEKEQRR
jgi:serine/threonine-protein kinase PpkA